MPNDNLNGVHVNTNSDCVILVVKNGPDCVQHYVNLTFVRLARC